MSTTVMVKNIPCRFTQTEFKDILDGAGFYGTFDLIYMPRGSLKDSNHGYCFVNFKSGQLAEWCRLSLDGQVLGKSTMKRCSVVFAYVQCGREALQASRRNRRLKGQAEPLLVDDPLPRELEARKGEVLFLTHALAEEESSSGKRTDALPPLFERHEQWSVVPPEAMEGDAWEQPTEAFDREADRPLIGSEEQTSNVEKLKRMMTDHPDMTFSC